MTIGDDDLCVDPKAGTTQTHPEHCCTHHVKLNSTAKHKEKIDIAAPVTSAQ